MKRISYSSPAALLGLLFGACANPQVASTRGEPALLPRASDNAELSIGGSSSLKPGMVLFNLVKLCVNESGHVTRVSIVKPSDLKFDNDCIRTMSKWRFKPMLVDGNVVSFCYTQRNVLKVVP